MLRVSAMAHDPATVKIAVRQVDVLVLLAAVDRLAQLAGEPGHPAGPAVRALFRGGVGTAFFAETVVLFGGTHTIGGPSDRRG